MSSFLKEPSIPNSSAWDLGLPGRSFSSVLNWGGKRGKSGHEANAGEALVQSLYSYLRLVGCLGLHMFLEKSSYLGEGEELASVIRHLGLETEMVHEEEKKRRRRK